MAPLQRRDADRDGSLPNRRMLSALRRHPGLLFLAFGQQLAEYLARDAGASEIIRRDACSVGNPPPLSVQVNKGHGD